LKVFTGLPPGHGTTVIRLVSCFLSFFYRFGAIAVTAQPFFVTATAYTNDLYKLRILTENEMEKDFSMRRSAVTKDHDMKLELSTSRMTAKDDLITRWLQLNARTNVANRDYSSFIMVLIVTQTLAFFTWAVNNLVNTNGSSVDSVIAGAVIMGTTFTTIVIIGVSSQMTREMERSATTAAEYWNCSQNADLRLLYPNLTATITMHLVQKDYATKIFDFTISRNFLFEYLGTVLSLTIAVLRLQASIT
jgi:hypothetical protein